MPTGIMRRLTPQSALLSLLMVAGLIIALYLVYEPRFETNDDVSMSMIAHGYGDAAYSSPLLIYSNVLWGYLVRATPTIGGVLGYSVAALVALMAAAWAIAYFLIRLGAGYFAAFLAVSLVLVRPALFPQFTVLAGLLTVAAVIGLQLYGRRGERGILVASCALVFVAFLVRQREAALVLAVAAPLLPWRALRERREAQVAVVMLALAIAAALVVDNLSYSGPEWAHFFEVLKTLSSILAWGNGEDLKQHPEILARYGYSKNDIELIQQSFWVDPQISNPQALNAMLLELDSARTEGGYIPKGIEGLRTLAEPALLPLMLGAFMLLVLTPRRTVALSWALCISAVIVFAALGRPGIVRIYLPLASLLLLASLAADQSGTRTKRCLTLVAICGAWIGNAFVLLPQASESTRQVQEFQRDLRGVPAGTIVNWANSVHHEFPYALLARDPKVRSVRLYDISAFSFAPFSVSMAENAAGRSFKTRLQSAEGVPMFTPMSYQHAQLEIYCREHLGNQLQAEFTYTSPSLNVRQVRCVVPR